MFWSDEVEELRARVARLAPPIDLDAHRQLVGLCQQLDALRVAHAGLVDAAGLWELDGATSMRAWLRSECGEGRSAARTVKAASVLRELRVVAEAWTSGALSSGQVEAITDLVGHHVARFAADEATLVPLLGPLGVADTVRAMQEWRAKADALDAGPEPVEAKASTLQLSELAGRGILQGDLDAHLHQLAVTALRTAEVHQPGQRPSERRADALQTIFEQFLDAQGVAYSTRHQRHRPHLNIVVDARSGLLEGRYVDGPPVDPATLDMLLCDCRLHRVLVDPELGIVGYGREVRTFTQHLFNAVVVRDEHCRWDGCSRPAAASDGHHVAWWERGGPTDLDNGVLLCKRHHRLLHVKDPTTRQPRWTASLEPDGTFTVTRTSDGLTRTTRPPGIAPKLW